MKPIGLKSFVVLAAILCSVEGAKILSLFQYPGKSQYIFISPLLKALAEKGHEVTSVSTFPQTKPLKNFRDVVVMENFRVIEDELVEIAEGKSLSFFDHLLGFALTGKTLVANVFANEEFKKIMESEKFDLIIIEVLGSEAFFGLGEYFQAPIIGVSTFGTANFLDYVVGNPLPLSYIPHLTLSYDNHMTLKQRIVNVLIEAFDRFCFNFIVLPNQEKLYRMQFPKAQISLDEARKNVSLVLLNDHFTLRSPRPYVPNMIEVGGLHIKQTAEALPEDLQEYLDNAKEGAIYFSMGSNLKSKDLPQDKLKVILETFRSLKMKVLWKFEAENLANQPENLLIRKWFNQSSILAHPNVKLFISHGGYLSMTETIFHGKPILGIPIVSDQHMNVKNAVNAGYALTLVLKEITMESFKSAIEELWTNPKYTQTVQRLSKRFRDQPLTPLDKALYWVEYVLRHEGAPHMRNAGQDLSFIEYHNLDVFLLLAMAVIIFITILIGIIYFLKMLMCKSMKFSKQSKIKKN
ncbi:UDP-glycosyltransferase UGT5-like [Haematobia irritans]|uniref:UDP-glycosyltransferase UGT5-like n=1 Tax=Haematobia irritans TaxID=7368 RepID=UPI003F50C5BE